MNKYFLLILGIFSLIILSGCTQLTYPNLPKTLANICLNQSSLKNVFECQENNFGIKYMATYPSNYSDAPSYYFNYEGNEIARCGGFVIYGGGDGNNSSEELCNNIYPINCSKQICPIDS